MTDQLFADWLKDSTAQRVTLYELDVLSGGAPVTLRLSNRAYGGGGATPYIAAIAEDLKTVEAISASGSPRLSAGKIGIHNVGGVRDSWLDYIVKNQEFRVYVGDMRWTLGDFRMYGRGIMEDSFGSDDQNQIDIEIRDITQRINTPISEALLPDGTLCPVTFGEALNVTPKIKNSVTGERAYHSDPSEGVIEARSEGKPREITQSLATGTFTLTTAAGPGAITCSAQGDKTGGIYRSTIGALIRLIVTTYGKADSRFTEAEIDTANFDAFEAANQQPVGLHLQERTNTIEACAQLASSVRAQLVPSRLGKLRLIQYGIPATATASILPSHYVEGSLKPRRRLPVVAAVKLGYCRNYTPQPNLQTSIPDEHKALLATEWRTVTAIDTVTRDQYKLTTEPAQVNTCFSAEADAQAEANRRLAQDKVPRTPYILEGAPITMLLELGQGVTLYGDRYGMSAGKLGQVTSIALDFGNLHTELEVTV